mgnify:CR=1 FL=1
MTAKLCIALSKRQLMTKNGRANYREFIKMLRVTISQKYLSKISMNIKKIYPENINSKDIIGSPK